MTKTLPLILGLLLLGAAPIHAQDAPTHELTVTATLGEVEGQPQLAATIRHFTEFEHSLLTVAHIPDPEATELELGDIILSVNDTRVTTPEELSAALASMQPAGSPSLIEVLRRGERVAISETPRAVHSDEPLLGVNLREDEGIIVVTAVSEGTAAARAGLQVGDVLVAINGARPADAEASRTRLQETGAFAEASLVLLRDGARVELALRLGSKTRGLGGFLGITQASREAGATVTAVLEGSGAAAAGLQVDDVILSVDGVAPTAERGLRDLILAHAPGDVVTLVVRRAGLPSDGE